jgi:hypothetical protein
VANAAVVDPLQAAGSFQDHQGGMVGNRSTSVPLPVASWGPRPIGANL